MARPQSLDSIEAKIAQLQAEAEELRARERNGVITRIVDGMRVYHITLADLRAALNGHAAPLPEAEPQPQRKRKVLSAEWRAAQGERMKALRARVMYRDNKGNTWSGIGQAPPWVKEWESQPNRSRIRWLVKDGAKGAKQSKQPDEEKAS